ncbi:MAG: acyl-CoA dehydrogenase family protein [Acidimicrobiales bacterium]
MCLDRAQVWHPWQSNVCLVLCDESGAIGWLVGDEGAGMRNMFTMMNNARLGAGMQGLAVAERAYQKSLAYAQERHQGTAVGAEKGTSSPIIDHPDAAFADDPAGMDRCAALPHLCQLDAARPGDVVDRR